MDKSLDNDLLEVGESINQMLEDEKNTLARLQRLIYDHQNRVHELIRVLAIKNSKE